MWRYVPARARWQVRLLFPVVCLVIWVLSIKLVTTIWPFAVDVLPTPWQVIKFMWDEITAQHRRADTTCTRRSRSRCSGLAIGMAIAW